jgi:ankyrin repeat protein/S1-C subfamily serine protease
MRIVKRHLYILMITALVGFACWGIAFDQAQAQDLERTSQLIVMIETENTLGAGIVFGRQNDRIYIATANHVVRKAGEAAHPKVLFRAMPEKWFAAVPSEHFDSTLDLAVISVENAAAHELDFCSLPIDRLGDNDTLKRGDGVYPVGYPGGAPWGMPVAPDRIAQMVGKRITFQSAFISSGHSGGGLLNEQAELSGMIRADQPPFGVAIRMESILQRLRQWGLPVQLRNATANVDAKFQSAIKTRDIKSLERLLFECAHVSTRDTTGWTPLHEAASQGWAAAVKPLLAAGVDANAKLVNHPDKPSGLTPLHVAAALNYSEVASVLLAGGADVNARIMDQQNGDWGPAPLHLAAESGATEAAKVLLKNGANVNARSNFGTPLMIAAKSQLAGADMAQILIENGADPDAKGWWASPLQYAAQRNAAGIIGILLANGADINKPPGRWRYTALHYAAQSGSTEAVQLLLEGGAEIDVPNSSENTALHIAIRKNHADAVRLLVEAGADVNATSGIYTRMFRNATPIILALDRNVVDVEIVKSLLKGGADTEIDEYVKGSIYRLAAEKGPEFAEFLLKVDFDIFGHTANGSTLLHLSVEKGRVELTKFLIRSGADVNAKGGSWDRSPLHLAAKHGQTEILKLLIKAGADVNGRNRIGKTPLHDAVRNPEIVTLLLEAGSDVNAFEDNLSTPLHLAAEIQMVRSAKILIAAGADKTARDRSHLTPEYRARSDDMIALFQTGWLGIEIQDVTQELADYLDLERPIGVFISNVFSGSPAEIADLKPKDVILEYDGHSVKNSNDLLPLVRRTPVGKSVVLKIVRRGKAMTLPVKIGKNKQ